MKVKTSKTDTSSDDDLLGGDPVAEPSRSTVAESGGIEGDNSKGDERFFEELKLLGTLRIVEQRRFELEGSISQVSSVVKDRKSVLKESESELSDLQTEMSEATQELLELSRGLLALKCGDALPTEEPELSEEEGWKLKPTGELLQQVNSLKEKRRTAIVEVAPTVGDLEALREKASLDGVAFHTVLPSGVGKTVAERIQERMAEFVTEYAKAINDPDRVKLADELVQEVRTTAEQYNWERSDCTPSNTDDEHVHGGYTAFNEGKPHTSFLSMDRVQARRWMVGWVGAERLSQMKEAA